MEAGLTRNKVFSELTKSVHRDFKSYLDVGKKAAVQDPEFFAHLIAWDRLNGDIRDSKVALPVVSLSVASYPDEYVDNSLAHLAVLNPKMLLRAVKFAYEIRLPNRMRTLRRLVERYLRNLESIESKWDRVALQHRASVKTLYSMIHIKPSLHANIVLNGTNLEGDLVPLPPGSVFEAVSRLGRMTDVEAATAIAKYRIPFLVAKGAVGARIKNHDLLLALIERMTPTELVTNTKDLNKFGMNNDPALRAAYQKGLEKAAESKKNVLKTTRAIEALEDVDPDAAAKLQGLQEKQLNKLSGVDGDWLVLGDRSGSMSASIDTAREVAALLAKMVKGKVWLVFFNASPQTVDVTGLTLDEIKKKTRGITANGGTSIGCGLLRMIDANENIDGIAIVSDGGDNTVPNFHQAYEQYAKKSGKNVPVYLYQVPGDHPHIIGMMKGAGYDLQVFDLAHNKTDYYSLPNLVSTMRTNRYSLTDEIMETKLLALSDVLKLDVKEIVNA